LVKWGSVGFGQVKSGKARLGHHSHLADDNSGSGVVR